MLKVEAAGLRQGGFALDASFEAPGDAITALFGPSGGGKSTLLAAIAGLKPLQSGRVILCDRVLADGRTHVAAHLRGIGLVFQDARLFPHRSVEQNLSYARKRAPKAGGPDIAEAARFFDIAALLKRPVTNLSGGEKSRVALARALVSAPDFLLLDEPFAALDGARRRAYIGILQAMHRAYGLPMLVVTHDIDDAAALASHLVALKSGSVVACGAFAPTALRPGFHALLDSRDVGVVLSARHVQAAQPDGMETIWLRADHVLLAARPPQAISARNIFPGHVKAILPAEKGGILVELQTEAGILLSRITREAAAELNLSAGTPAWAIVKAHAL